MATTLRIAFVGAGNMAREHTKALLQHPEADIVAYADTEADKCAARIRQVQEARPDAQPQAFSDAVAMLHTVAPDATYIVVPPFGHGPAELTCVELGIPFFAEKPVGLDWGQTREIATAVRSAGLLTCVGYMNRYRKGVQTAKKVLESDPPVLLHGGWVGGSPGPGSWWIQKALSGGQMVEQSTHTFDLVRYLAGEATEVFAHAAVGFNRGIPGYDIEDASAVTIHLLNGGVAVLLSCCAANGGGGGVWLSVFTHNTTFLFTGWEHSVRVMTASQPPEDIAGEPDIFAIEDRVFLDAVRNGDASQVLSTYEDGARTLALTLAAEASLRTGRAVAPAQL